VALETFCSKRQWFCAKAAPDVDRRAVAAVEPTKQGFALRTEDSEEFEAAIVVIADGTEPG
jgi:hypothetical protein